MKTILRAWCAEYRAIFGDAGALLIFFGAILVYPIVYPIPFWGEVLKKIPVAVVDMDRSQLSRKLVRMMDAHETLNVAARPSSLAEAEELFYRGGIKGIVVVPNDFERDILRGRQVTVPAYCDASYFLLYRQVLTGVMQSSGTLSAGVEIKRLMARGAAREQAIAARDPLPLLSIPLFNPGGGYATYGVPPVMLLILQQTLLIGIGMLQGTARAGAAATGAGTGANLTDARPGPGARTQAWAILGKGMAYFTIYLIHAIYIIVILFRLYRFPQRGAPLSLLLFLFPFLLSVIFLGLTISAFFKDRETSMVVLLFTSVPALFLAGFSWPVEAIPRWLHLASLTIPTTAGIDGFLKINSMGARLNEVATQWAVLWGLAILYFFLAWLFAHLRSRRNRATLSVPPDFG